MNKYKSNLKMEDILNRHTFDFYDEDINKLINEKVVLVTGGGGSIGSELCRQIIKYNPKQLIIFDIYENNLYNIEIELKEKYSDIKIEAIVGSIRDNKKLEWLFKTYNIQLVFHAAAHKHVPLMEINPLEAIKNNVIGTYNLVKYVNEYNVEKFVLISSDKAVNPTSIMGATKRLCEMIIQAKNNESNTDFVAVRFGNVLGSNGSVVPLFERQIKEGGPVTITDKEVTRFFMTITESVGLILQAASYAEGGEIFVLDMGDPIKIYDLAINIINTLGYRPEVDIPIKIIGLRPGEKLYEELLMEEENLKETKYEGIFIAKPLNINQSQVEEKMKILIKLVSNENIKIDEVKENMKILVDTYKESDQIERVYE